jgi:predicted DCC family thiol-disulfide oxidoreductase YuxK
VPDRILVFYDGQCGVCRSVIGWLHRLDRHGRTECVPIGPAAVERAGLTMEACLREIQVATPRGVRSGWNGVAYLARLFPATWIIGALGGVPPFRWLGNVLYRWFAKHRHGISCRIG